MKVNFGVRVVAAAVVASAVYGSVGSQAFADAKELALDTAQSSLKWTGKKVTGSHFGSVKLAKGTVAMNGEEITSGSFEIDMSSIVVDDIKDPKYNKKLADHLKSDDFFNVVGFPKSSFEITSAKKMPAPGPNGENYEITGSLSVLGIEHPVTFPAKVTINGANASASGVVKIDRTKFGIRYGSGRFFENLGDKMIYDEFQVELNLVASLKA